MVAVTSISPVHVNKDIQAQAVQSWIDCGMKVYSINNKEECKKLAPIYPNVTFVETQRTMEETFGKPYVSLSAIFDWCKTQPDNVFCLINSDIELKTDKETIERIEKKAIDNNLILANRVNYVSDYKGSRYLAGIDVFFMNKQIIHSFPQNLFCLGQCHFDYYMAYPTWQPNVLIYIDSHWHGTPCPLKDELKLISELEIKPIICIHDFKVPGKDFGFDAYDYELCFEEIEPYLNDIYKDGYDYHYNEDAGGAYRGIIFIYPKR